MVFPQRAIRPQVRLTADVLSFTEVEAVPRGCGCSVITVGGRRPCPVTLHISFVNAELRCHNFQEDVTLPLSLQSFFCLNSSIFVFRGLYSLQTDCRQHMLRCCFLMNILQGAWENTIVHREIGTSWFNELILSKVVK